MMLFAVLLILTTPGGNQINFIGEERFANMSECILAAQEAAHAAALIAHIIKSDPLSVGCKAVGRMA